jgi:hypothetical protein
VLFTAGSWLTLHGGSRDLLYQDITPCAEETTILEDGSAHRFLALVPVSDTETRVCAYHLQSDGGWKQLALHPQPSRARSHETRSFTQHADWPRLQERLGYALLTDAWVSSQRLQSQCSRIA